MDQRIDYSLIVEKHLGILEMTSAEQIRAIPKEKFTALVDEINRLRGIGTEAKKDPAT